MREATFGFLVLIGLLGILAFTIYAKATGLFATRADVPFQPARLVEVQADGTLGPIVPRKPLLVQLPDNETNQLVDLEGMQRISANQLFGGDDAGAEADSDVVRVADAGDSLGADLDLPTDVLEEIPDRAPDPSVEDALPSAALLGKKDEEAAASLSTPLPSTPQLPGALADLPGPEDLTSPPVAAEEKTPGLGLPVAQRPESTPSSNTSPVTPLAAPPNIYQRLSQANEEGKANAAAGPGKAPTLPGLPLPELPNELRPPSVISATEASAEENENDGAMLLPPTGNQVDNPIAKVDFQENDPVSASLPNQLRGEEPLTVAEQDSNPLPHPALPPELTKPVTSDSSHEILSQPNVLRATPSPAQDLPAAPALPNVATTEMAVEEVGANHEEAEFNPESTEVAAEPAGSKQQEWPSPTLMEKDAPETGQSLQQTNAKPAETVLPGRDPMVDDILAASLKKAAREYEAPAWEKLEATNDPEVASELHTAREENSAALIPSVNFPPTAPGVSLPAADSDGETTAAHPAVPERVSYSQADIRSAARMVVLQPGEGLPDIARRLYGSPDWSLPLLQFNRKRASTDGEFAAGTRILVLPKPMLRFLYPRFSPQEPGQATTESPDRSGVQPVQFQQSLPNAAEPRTMYYQTRGGETIFGLAGEYLGQASRYTELMKRNQQVLNGKWGHADPLPAGLKIQFPID